ncbi:hypothetical protein [Motilibacter deserti]|uniref:Uncharacterized protein n=1 Tax=Motilibacter deserti TaxID=2714956 RepID=A0ABX0GZI8_9ACTN|nr:hypothetical protein [Motilibacter deserti]NHC16437.1 hypothetical protein [Motilibacter deserti]
MDERLAAINEQVAAAVDAWMADPRDVGVYQRMVAAVEARRAHLHPPPRLRPLEPDAQASLAPAEEPAEEIVGTADIGSVQRVGSLLAGGDPRAAIERLRRGR